MERRCFASAMVKRGRVRGDESRCVAPPHPARTSSAPPSPTRGEGKKTANRSTGNADQHAREFFRRHHHGVVAGGDFGPAPSLLRLDPVARALQRRITNVYAVVCAFAVAPPAPAANPAIAIVFRTSDVP